MIIAARQPRNPIGWLFCAIGLSAAIPMLAIPYAVYALRVNPGALPGAVLMTWLASWVWLPGASLIPLLLLPFPDGRLLSPRWRWAVWATALGATLGTLDTARLSWSLRGAALLPYLESGTDYQIDGGVLSQILATIAVLLSLSGFIASIITITLRFRRSRGVERQQLKWFTYAIALAACIELVLIVRSSIYGEKTKDLLDLGLIGLSTISIVGIALSVAIAILRYRLYDIDIIINRTLVYGALTLTLGLIYVGCIAVSRMLVAPLVGGSEIAITASTLAIAALFNPLRRRIQNTIDKHFYRRKYDAAKVLAAFGTTVRDETDLDPLTAELVRVVDETMQPEFVGLWLRDPQGVAQQKRRPVPSRDPRPRSPNHRRGGRNDLSLPRPFRRSPFKPAASVAASHPPPPCPPPAGSARRRRAARRDGPGCPAWSLVRR
jgi:hypothetical protein